MAYKPKSDSYLMSFTKSQLIAELRVAEHNFTVTENALKISSQTGKNIYEENKKLKKLLAEAVDILKCNTCAIECKTCVNFGKKSGKCNLHYKWNKTDEALSMINKEKTSE